MAEFHLDEINCFRFMAVPWSRCYNVECSQPCVTKGGAGWLFRPSHWTESVTICPLICCDYRPAPPLVTNQSIISMQAAYFCQPNNAFHSFNEKPGNPELHNVPWYLKPRLLRTSLIPVDIQISFLLEPTVLKSLSPLSEYLNSKVRPRLNWLYLIRILWMDFHSLFSSIG